MLGHGHPKARLYPLGMVWDEGRLVVDRLNGLMATEMTLLQLAVAGVLSKKAGKEFEKQINRITED